MNIWTNKPATPELQTQEIHLYKIMVSKSSPKIDDFRSVLSHHELKNASQFYQQEDQIRYIIARGALKHILSCYLKKMPYDISFIYNEYGKPTLPPEINSIGINFNLSHSKNLILCGITLNHSIGVDVEYHANNDDFVGIAELVFSEQEFRQLQNTEPEKKMTSFYQLWTYKEAFIKALGAGFSYNTKSFTIEDKGSLVTFKDEKFHNLNSTHWFISKVYAENNYSAAFATQQVIKKIEYFEYFCLNNL